MHLRALWRRNINSDRRGHDLHDPKKDCSIALDRFRTTQGRLYGGGYRDPQRGLPARFLHKAMQGIGRSRRQRCTEATHSRLRVDVSTPVRTDSTGESTHGTAHVCFARELVISWYTPNDSADGFTSITAAPHRTQSSCRVEQGN